MGLTEKAALSQSKPRGKAKKWLISMLLLFAMLILSFLLALGMHIFKLVQDIKKNGPGIEIESVKLTEGETALIYGDKNNFWLGSDKPKVTIVEFGDFACPMCEQSFSKLREISVKYKNDVKIIFRDFPVVADYSSDLAMAARCAGEQGLFWPMHDKLFLNQGVSTSAELTELAKEIGADTVRFSFCLEQKKYETEITKDISDGVGLEIAGTPTWYINGNKIEGDVPYETFIKIIETLIRNPN